MESPRTNQPTSNTPQPSAPANQPNALCRTTGSLLVLIARILKPLAILGAIVGLLATLALIAVSLASANWITLALQVGALTGAAFALTSALSRYPAAPALALFCSGSVLAACAILTEPAFVTILLPTGTNYISVSAFSLDIMLIWLAGPQVVAGTLVAARAIFLVWSRDPARSAAYLLHAVWTGIATLAILAIMLFATRPGAMATLQNALGSKWMAQAALAVGAILGFFIFVGFISACGHCLIRSLEVGKLDEDTKAT